MTCPKKKLMQKRLLRAYYQKKHNEEYRIVAIDLKKALSKMFEFSIRKRVP